MSAPQLSTQKKDLMEKNNAILNNRLVQAENMIKMLQHTTQLHSDGFNDITNRVSTITTRITAMDMQINRILQNQEISMAIENKRATQLNQILNHLNLGSNITSLNNQQENHFPNPYEHNTPPLRNTIQQHHNEFVYENPHKEFYSQSDCGLQSILEHEMNDSHSDETINNNSDDTAYNEQIPYDEQLNLDNSSASSYYEPSPSITGFAARLNPFSRH